MTAKNFSIRKRAVLLERNFRHGYAPRNGMISEYRVWHGIKSRCLNPRNPGYPRYGGRGITICEAWRDDFQAFFDHIGQRPTAKHQLDRRNNDGNYEPGNVRWVTRTQNLRNCSSNLMIEIDGVTKCAAEWDERAGFKASSKTVARRYKRGWRGQKLLVSVGSIKSQPRPQSLAERRKRAAAMSRLWARQVYRDIGDKISAIKRKQFAERTAYNKRDARGCFVAGVARNAKDAEELLRS